MSRPLFARRFQLSALALALALTGCDSGGSDGPEPTPERPAVPTIVGASYVNKAYSESHVTGTEGLNALAGPGEGRGGEPYVRLIDLTLEFADGVEPSTLRRLRVFGTYGGSNGGSAGVGWEWDEADLDALTADGQRLLLPDLVLPSSARGDAILDIRAETDTVATFDVLHKNEFVVPPYPYEPEWVDVDEIQAFLYNYNSASSELPGTVEAAWLGAGGQTEVGRSAVTVTSNPYDGLVVRAAGAPASADQVYFEVTGRWRGADFVSRTAITTLPPRLPENVAFLDDVDANGLADVAPSGDGFLLRYRSVSGAATLAFVRADGSSSGPFVLTGEPSASALSPDGQTAWVGYESGAVDRFDLASGTQTAFATAGGPIAGLHDTGTALMASVCLDPSGSNCYDAAMTAIDRTTGDIRHVFTNLSYTFSDFSYHPATRVLYGHRSSSSSYSYAFELTASGAVLDVESVYIDTYYAGTDRAWLLLEGRSEWVTRTGHVLRQTTSNSPDLEQVGQYRLTGTQDYIGAFASDPAANRVAGMGTVYASNTGQESVVFALFEMASRARLLQFPLPGRRAYDLTRTDSGYVGLVSAGSRLFLLPITDAELSPARRAPLHVTLPTL